MRRNWLNHVVRFQMKTYWVYIRANRNHHTYIGMSGDIEGRLWEHRNGITSQFASRYGMTKLVYIEYYDQVDDAIARERQLKTWRRDEEGRFDRTTESRLA